MENQATRNFKVFPTPEEQIEANKYEQSCYLKITKKDIKNCDSTTSFDSTLESSISSASFSSSSSSSSSSDLMEDATSPSTTTTSSSSSNGPLYQLSDLMDKLPIKRGLSKYYEGKSESFTSLASVGNLEDLVKRENPYKKKFKLCRNNNNYFSSPKSSISKKSCYSRTPFSSSLLVSRTCSNNFKPSCRPPTIPPVQKEF